MPETKEAPQRTDVLFAVGKIEAKHEAKRAKTQLRSSSKAELRKIADQKSPGGPDRRRGAREALKTTGPIRKKRSKRAKRAKVVEPTDDA